MGAILIPGMLEKGYPRDFSAATISIASCLGVMIPPSVPMVLYCFMAGSGVSISDGFLAGVVPGFLFALVLIVVAVVISHKGATAVTGNTPARRSGVPLRTPFWPCSLQ